MRIAPILPRALLALAAMLALSSCKGPEPLGPAVTIADLISRVTTSDGSLEAVLHAGMAPAPGVGAAPVVPSEATAVNGGSAAVGIEAGAEFTRVAVAVAGVDGWYELVLPAGVSASDIVVGISPDANTTTLDMLYGVSTDGAPGQYGTQSLRVFRVGTGDVQVSISWTGASDVDLHVFDPSGEEVYFANLESASGGTLDLDSNAGCSIDNVNNENIVWPTGVAPRGDYRVVVDYWSDCGVPRSDYVVTVAMAGQAPQVFTGSFIGTSASNPAVEIGTFTY